MSPEDLATPPPPVVAPAGTNPYVMPSPSSGPPPKSQSPSYLLPSCSFAAASALVPGLNLMVSVCADRCGSAAGAKENLMEMFGQAGKRFTEAARKTEGIAGDVWQHCESPKIPIIPS
jgi:hypothetical protein